MWLHRRLGGCPSLDRTARKRFQDREVTMAEQLKEPGISDCAPTLARAASPGFPTERVVPLLIGATVEEVERELVLQTLVHCHGNRTRAANVLGVSIRTLRNKIKDYAA